MRTDHRRSHLLCRTATAKVGRRLKVLCLAERRTSLCPLIVSPRSVQNVRRHRPHRDTKLLLAATQPSVVGDEGIGDSMGSSQSMSERLTQSEFLYVSKVSCSTGGRLGLKIQLFQIPGVKPGRCPVILFDHGASVAPSMPELITLIRS